MDTHTSRRPHIGRNIVRIRELKNIKQEGLATMLGVSQQTISRMEQSEEIDEKRLEQVATALGVSIDAIKNFSEDAVIYHMNNIHNNHDSSVNAVIYYQMSPVDKITELYERLLSQERQRVLELQEEIRRLSSGKK